MKLQFQWRTGRIVALFRQASRALLFLRPSEPRDLDFSSRVCDTLRPISRAAAGERPPAHDVGGMTRIRMHRFGPYLTALSAANASPFNRPSKRGVMCVTIQVSVSRTRHGRRLRQTA
jgi:hypothetical protein